MTLHGLLDISAQTLKISRTLGNTVNVFYFLKNESQGHALRACVYIYIRKHNLLPFIACCIALFEVIRKLV